MLDELNTRWRRCFEGGALPEAFDIWYRNCDCDGTQGEYLEEVQALGLAGEIAGRELSMIALLLAFARDSERGSK